MTEISLVLVPALISASVAVVITVATPVVTSLQRRRDDLHNRFDKAVASLLNVQTARHIARNISREYHSGTEEEYRLFYLQMEENSILMYVDETVKARKALVDIAAYVPEVREWVDSGWELTGQQEPEQRMIIERRRKEAIRSQRLVGSRKVSPLPIKPRKWRLWRRPEGG